VSRLAVVTGASSGIGEAYAERLAADGWDLQVVARRQDRLDALARRLSDRHGVDIRAVAADLSRRDELDRFLREVGELQVDLLVNNAALAYYMPFVDLAPAAAQELVDLNVLAPVLLTRAVLPGMLERGNGAVVNVASLLAFSGAWEAPHLPRRAVYASTKAFLLMFTQVLAAELQRTGVHVQVVCPGVVRTEFHSRQGLDMSARPRMEPGDVVAASLTDLERGRVVSIPGADEASLDRVVEAQQQLFPFVAATALPARYR
jgi:short-subunit dehydrogenase